VSTSQIYIVVFLAAMAVVALRVFFVLKNGHDGRTTSLAGIAATCVVTGIIFSDDGWIGYGFLGAGALLGLAEAFGRARAK
jgi:heme/copper-type cytochrome/quinol oxidase subunit 4